MTGASEPVEVVLEGFQARSFCLLREAPEEALQEAKIRHGGAYLRPRPFFRMWRIDVFLSHNSKDKLHVREVAHHLDSTLLAGFS